jgi:putative PEP-CTERM system histidine kinase
MAALVEADAGVLWLHRSIKSGEGFERIAVLGKVEDAPGGLEVTDPAIGFMAKRKWTIDVAEALRDPQSHPGLALPEWAPRMGRSMLIVPLLGGDTLWGIAALLRPRSVGKLTYEDIDLLKVAGMQVAAVLAQGEADRLLAESRQFEAYNRFAAFIMHDLKNIIAQQSLLVRNAARHKADPAFVDDLVETVENSVRRMQRLLEQLKRGQGREVTERVALGKLLFEVARQHRDRAPVPEVHPVDPAIRLHTNRERLSAVLGHLVANAQDATPAEGRVRIGAALADGALVIWVEDSGGGMDEDFIRNRLFRPFDSTKGTQGMGIGAYQARQFAESAGGEVKVTSAPGVGTRFELRFPATLADGAGYRAPEAVTMDGPGREATGG